MQHQGQEQAVTLGSMGVKTHAHVPREEKHLRYLKCGKNKNKIKSHNVTRMKVL